MDVLLANRNVFLASTKELDRYIAAEEKRRKLLSELCNQYYAAADGVSDDGGNVETFGGLGKSKIVAAEDEKENFLMPAPKGRPRNRKRNTKDALEDVRMSKSSRVTRSSKMSEIVMHEETLLVKKGRKTKSSVKESLISVQDTKISILETSDTTTTGESRKSRRTTKKGIENSVPRASTRATRASTRASSRSSKRKSTTFKLRDTLGPKRVTRSKATNASNLEPEESCSIPELSVSRTSNKNNHNVKAALFSPYGKHSVKVRVEAFEGLSTAPVVTEEKAKKSAFKVVSPVQMATQPNNVPLIPGTPSKILLLSTTASSSSLEGGKRIDSPLISRKNNIGLQKHDVVVESLEEEADQEVSAMEVVEDAQIEEILDSPNITEESGTPEESKNTELHTHDQVFVQKSKGKKMLGDDENEADDEWMTDDEGSKTPKTAGQNSSISSTPKVKTSASKASQEALGSYKALRSRKVKKMSDVSLTLSSKAKTPKTAALVKPPEMDTEVDLKKQKEEERQNEALRRKEELLKKRTEITKKKREEKMTKVKRTREEKEKEKEVKKLKKAKLMEGKKKKKDAVAEAETTKTPINKVASPNDEAQNLNATFDVPGKKSNAGDAYNMTPHWQDVPPKQPDNPNDFGIADNSDCSSGEETDPRKKIPLWAQMKSNDNLLLTQCLLPVSIINEYWQSKPRAPTIREFFGNHVSSKTLRRGLNYRTSSAMWNTPPLKN